MNNLSYRPRFLAELLRQALSFSPVVVLTGPRQVGKSTLLREEPPFRDWPYLSLDDPDTLILLRRRAREIVFREPRLVLDEIQRAPELLLYVKQAVDEDRSRRLVLSGSANLLLMKNVSETLAGRAVYLELGPFSLSEFLERPSGILTLIREGRLIEASPPESTLEDLLFRGLTPPAAFLSSPEEARLWWRGYVATYLERDLRDLSQVADLADFHRFLEALAARTASLLNVSEAARDAGLSQPTASRYLNLLETSGLVFRLRPYHTSLSKRLAKRPKLYFFDTGLACTLAGYLSPEDLSEGFRGRLFENFVFQHLRQAAVLLSGELYFFRRPYGKEIEVDFLLRVGRRFHAFEVKLTTRPGLREAENLLAIKDLLPDPVELYLVHAGTSAETLPGGIKLIPWHLL
ncbi:MAG: ATP-binding protein [Thermodesulfatator sp.]|nr:MAG: ATP-binding protein [Thermodesulfatator sp.]